MEKGAIEATPETPRPVEKEQHEDNKIILMRGKEKSEIGIQGY